MANIGLELTAGSERKISVCPPWTDMSGQIMVQRLQPTLATASCPTVGLPNRAQSLLMETPLELHLSIPSRIPRKGPNTAVLQILTIA